MGKRKALGQNRWLPGWHKLLADDGASANIYDGEDRLVEVEYYEFTGEHCGSEPLVNVRIETADGKLVGRHVSHRISATECDIHVIDAEGKLQLILHHSDIDRGEPVTIREERID